MIDDVFRDLVHFILPFGITTCTHNYYMSNIIYEQTIQIRVGSITREWDRYPGHVLRLCSRNELSVYSKNSLTVSSSLHRAYLRQRNCL